MSTTRRRPVVAVIGPGAVGRTLGRLLRRAGFPVVVAGRRPATARAGARWIGAPCLPDPAAAARRADWILLTVPDDAIAPAARALATAGALRPGQVVMHTCGLHGSDLLAPARRAGAAVASLHPLHSFARPARSLRTVRGCTCAIEGDRRAVSAARRLARAVGGRPLPVDRPRKALYHASAVLASNDLVALFGAGIRLLRSAGVGRRDAERALRDLVEGTVGNLRRVGYPRALTGPVARGDVGTIRAHLRALRRFAPDLLPAYRAAGALSVRTAREKGSLKPKAARILDALLSGAGSRRPAEASRKDP
jgi:predicted short-subunit dehydrogenase-like oxidoreductase (DUF2520 family)